MVAHLLIVPLVRVDIQKKILNFKDTKVIAIDRDKETENFAGIVSSKYQDRFLSSKTKNLVN